MEQATRNFLTLVNDSIEEAGDDLASFVVDGSDFTTNTDAQMVRFKKWVNRAWRDIQQESLDWEWMSQQGIVNIVPGIMFYSADEINALDFDYTTTIFDVDGTERVTPLTVTNIVPLTGTYTDTLNFGYVKLESSGDSPLSFGMKAGGEYMFAPENVVLTLASRDSGLLYTGSAPTFDTQVTQVEWVASVAGGAQFSDSITVVGSGCTASNASFSCTITAGTGEWWAESLSAALTNRDYVGLTLIVTYDGGTASVTLAGYENQNAAYILCSPMPPVQDQTAATKVVQIVGTDVVFSGLTLGMEIDEVVIASTGTSIDATYDNQDGVVTYINESPTLGAKFNLEIKDPDLIDAILFGNGSTSGNITITFKSAGVTKAVATKTQPNTTNKFFWVYFPYLTGDPGKMYIHSWRSFDFSEETEPDDFVEDIREINPSTFRIIYHEDPAISAELPLQCIPWSSFQNKFDFASATCSTPRIISEDNTGRWRLYPPPDRPYTLLFDYVREPQTLSTYTDVPKGLPEEYTDLIMWRAIAYCGEYDEQPSVAMRAWKNYKTLLMRFELQTREKFHFKSAYSWSSSTMGR